MEDLERIVGVKGIRKEARLKWSKISNKILSQARLEGRNQSVHSALDMAMDFKGA